MAKEVSKEVVWKFSKPHTHTDGTYGVDLEKIEQFKDENGIIRKEKKDEEANKFHFLLHETEEERKRRLLGVPLRGPY